MTPGLTIACVLKSGAIYDASWVARLAAGCARFAPPHRFVCLSDVAVPCERIRLEHGWPGWWSKVEVLRLEGPLLYFDLDTLIVGDLAEIAHDASVSPFIMLRDFYRPSGLGSGVMGWNGFDVSAACFYDRFNHDPEYWIGRCGAEGDQGFIERVARLDAIYRWQDARPGQIVSYKADGCARGVPDGARVICLHGKPKFPDMAANDPVRRLWERAA